VLYEREIQELTAFFPIQQLMVETDGPWPFEGPFAGQLTHPLMIHQSIVKIAKIKQVELEHVYKTIFQNTVQFYRF
jgi:TatD DNase family protein